MRIKLFNNDTWAKVVAPALAAAGHDAKGFVVTACMKLEAVAEQRYPALVATFKQGFADVESSDLHGLAKMAKVVEDILPRVPELAEELGRLLNLTGFLLCRGADAVERRGGSRGGRGRQAGRAAGVIGAGCPLSRRHPVFGQANVTFARR